MKINLETLTPEIVGSVLRHGMTALGPLLVYTGLASAGSLNEIIGAVITLYGFVWSIWRKLKRAKKE